MGLHLRPRRREKGEDMNDETVDEFIERRCRELVEEAATKPEHPKCDHVWHYEDYPDGGYGPTYCELCGMLFMRYAFTECL